MRAKWAQRMMAAMAIAGNLMGAGQAADFVAGFDDLPLMTALSEIPEAAVTFDTAAGRIVIAVAEGRADRAAVIAYYSRVLPQFGWRRTPAESGRFDREGERLVLDFPTTDGGLTVVRFTLTPQP